MPLQTLITIAMLSFVMGDPPYIKIILDDIEFIKETIRTNTHYSTTLAKHLRENPDFETACAYLNTENWTEKVRKLIAHSAYQKIADLLLPYQIHLENYLLTDHSNRCAERGARRNLKDFVTEILGRLDFAAIKQLVFYLADMHKPFRDFCKTARSEEMKGLVKELFGTDEFRMIDVELRGMGVPMTYLRRQLYYLLGWKE